MINQKKATNNPNPISNIQYEEDTILVKELTKNLLVVKYIKSVGFLSGIFSPDRDDF